MRKTSAIEIKVTVVPNDKGDRSLKEEITSSFLFQHIRRSSTHN
jgi:hypothetical protein